MIMPRLNNKIIGFTIHTSPIDHSDVDLFKIGLKQKLIEHGGFYIYLWGIGNLSRCVVGNKIALSFPVHFLLEDRNVVITLGQENITVENDWLGSIPVFYNTRTRAVSTLINKIIEPQDMQIHPEGLANYLDFGFCVFEQTQLKNIKFMRYLSELVITGNRIKIVYRKDDLISHLDSETTPKNAIGSISDYVSMVEKKVTGPIIIPTSGGFDSRVLNIMIKDKKRIRSFSYGISKRQFDSIEVVKAKTLSEILATSWNKIKLQGAAKYWRQWFTLYGGAVHLHGMYHIEFFKKITQRLGSTDGSVLSGIIGDAWSGLVAIPQIHNLQELPTLAYAHGISFDSRFVKQSFKNHLSVRFYNEHKGQLANSSFRIVASMRIKLILLSYLMSLPDYFGLPSSTPFLNRKVVLQMLNLPPSQRQDRLWQRQFFAIHGADLESQKLKFTSENVSDVELVRKHPLPPVRTQLLSRYLSYFKLFKVNIGYHRLLNAHDNDFPIVNRLLKYRIVGRLLKFWGVKPKYYLEPYNQLIVLKSLELMLEQVK